MTHITELLASKTPTEDFLCILRAHMPIHAYITENPLTAVECIYKQHENNPEDNVSNSTLFFMISFKTKRSREGVSRLLNLILRFNYIIICTLDNYTFSVMLRTIYTPGFTSLEDMVSAP